MTPTVAATVRLSSSPRGNRQGTLYPAQTADFDITMQNTGPDPVQTVSLEGNLDTPVIRVFGPNGLLSQTDRRMRAERMVGNASTLVQSAPKMVVLQPGATNGTWVNLWGFRDPLPPGTYSLQIVQKAGGAVGTLTSERQEFQIVPVRVRCGAFGYDSRNRAQTELAWLAAPEGASKARLLLRESGFAGHGSLHQGATMLGEFDPQTLLALGQLAWDAQVTPMGWVAALSREGRVDLFFQAATFPQGKPLQASLGVQNPVPVPRSPFRGGAAIVLATGDSPKGPALAGAVLNPQGPPRTWTVPLPSLPRMTACAFMSTGPLHVLLVVDDGHQSTVSILDVDENGKAPHPPQVVRTTTNAIEAVTVGQRSPQAFFYLLEADRTRHNRMALLRIAADGDRKLLPTDLGLLKGWPTTGSAETPEPVRMTAIQIEQAPDGSVWAAMTDPQGNLFGGQVDQALVMIHEAKGAPLLFPYVAALKISVSCFGFHPNGQLFLPDGSRHSH